MNRSPNEHQLSELSGIKFWPSVCSFYGECNQTKIQMYNQAAAEEAGAEFYFGTTAEYIVMEDGAVAGLVASDADGYVKINCKAVVCACGGMGGIITNGEQNALDANYEPIPGLYMAGNDCGRRFGTEYITPIPGVSLAFALVLGRECGKSVAKFLG